MFRIIDALQPQKHCHPCGQKLKSTDVSEALVGMFVLHSTQADILLTYPWDTDRRHHGRQPAARSTVRQPGSANAVTEMASQLDHSVEAGHQD